VSDIIQAIRDQDQAHRDNWQNRLAEEGELYGDDLQCPYCGYTQEDLTDEYDLIAEEGGEHTCANCDKDFDVMVDISFTFTCKPIQPEGGE